ncbi:hypothetical protein QQ020_32780 [Fulvivirgaceae bacterium BMA12]|uniref:Alpha-L-arabinofuranosidase 1 catalytic domain-containing protein n=1 Tax=Agaribacillus aureus TaxID=3051825 RepID=A0ABT8LGJ4_9BACT|nr:hypothetical protein [Fulvivirgaceae bacterium BMA12]
MKDVKSILIWFIACIQAAYSTNAQTEQIKDRTYVNIDKQHPLHQISKYLTGSHFVYAVESDKLYEDERIIQWMKDSKVGTIRYPGGTVVMAYHWDALNGIPFKTDSWDPEYEEKNKPAEDFMDVDEYIDFCRKTGTEPMLGINILSGKKYDREEEAMEEARRLILHCKKNNYGVKFWYIGNEGYAKGFSALEYAAYIDKYGAILKSVDPEIMIIGDWKFGPIWKDRFNQCIRIVKHSRHIDVLEIHEKWGNPWGLASGHSLKEWQNEFPLYDGKLGDYIQRFHDAMARIGREDVKIGFNEWGLGSVKNTNKYHNALFAADYLISLFRNDVYMANYWNLNMGDAQTRILETGSDRQTLIRLNPIAQIFEMFAHAQGKMLLRVECTHKKVYGFASLDTATGNTDLYLLNKSAEETNIEITGIDRKSIKEVWHESFTEPSGKVNKEVKVSTKGKFQAQTLGPWSLNRITFVSK